MTAHSIGNTSTMNYGFSGTGNTAQVITSMGTNGSDTSMSHYQTRDYFNKG